MIHLVQCVRRRPDLSPQEFRRKWREYGERIGEVAEKLGGVRVTLHTTLEVEINRKLVAERGLAAPFDGVATIAWKSGAGLLEATQAEAALEQLQGFWQFQESFVSLGESSFFFVSEETAYGLGG
jgi:hypothetical protein